MPIANPYAKPSNPHAKKAPVLVSKNVVVARASKPNLGAAVKQHQLQHQLQLPAMPKNSVAKPLVVTSEPSTKMKLPTTITPTPTPAAVKLPTTKALPTKKHSFKAQLKEQIQQLKQQKLLEKQRQDKEKREAADKIRLEAERKRMEPILAANRKKREEADQVIQHLLLKQRQEQQAKKEQPQLQQHHEQQQIRDQQQRLQQVRQEQRIHQTVKPPTTPSQPTLALATNTPQPTLFQHQVTPSPTSCMSNTNTEPIKLSVAQPFAQHHALPVHQFHVPPYCRPAYTSGYPMMNYHHPYSPTMPYPFYSPTANPAAAIRSMPQYAPIMKPPILKPITKPPDILSKDLMISPSPYFHTHVLLSTPLIIYKPPNGSFGISLKVETTSILVEPPLTNRNVVANLLHQMVNTISLQHNEPTTQLRRKRRRRLALCAMSVVDSTKQNAISLSTERLHPGDIVLSIHGVSTSGRSFPEACQLFGLAKEEREGMVQCNVLVARRKHVAAKPTVAKLPLTLPPLPVVPTSDINPTKIPFSYNETTNQVLGGDFSADELVVLAHGMIKLLTDKTRLLGFKAPGALEAAALLQPGRALSDVKLKWTQLTRAFERNVHLAATAHWNGWTDSQRAALRAQPRPVQGCRCKSTTHTHVHDSKCCLYDDLRPLLSKSPPPPRRHALETSLKDLSALETAFKDRFVKLKEEQVKEEDEARFVAEMERIQLTTLRKAIFAPSLTVIILSSLASISDEFEKMATIKTAEKTPSLVKETPPAPLHVVDVDSEDDVPLMALGKRGALLPGKERESKKQKTEETPPCEVGFNVLFLGKLLLHMSKTWGHVYREPSHKDYAWRWEVFHGSCSEQGTMPGGKNPKTPGSTTLETLQFGLNEDLMSRLECVGFGCAGFGIGEPKSDQKETEQRNKLAAEAALIVAHLVSPERSGILDELLSLARSGIIRKTKNGGAVLRKNWSSQVDPLLLDDMNARWSLDADPENKHCLNNKIRFNLASYWIRLDGAWALSEDMGEEVYLDQDFEEWRQTFEEKAEMKSNKEEGIGRFGI